MYSIDGYEVIENNGLTVASTRKSSIRVPLGISTRLSCVQINVDRTMKRLMTRFYRITRENNVEWVIESL